MKVLIIGANGHVGTAAVRALEGKHELIQVGRSTTPSVDLDDPATIEKLFTEVGDVDAIICTAGHVPFKPVTELTREDFADPASTARRSPSSTSCASACPMSGTADRSP